MIGDALEFRMDISGISNVYINLLRSKMAGRFMLHFNHNHRKGI